eukprot:COSAG01_NODE_6338_length_3728_cov_2.590521_2_plen_60_part_00
MAGTLGISGRGGGRRWRRDDGRLRQRHDNHGRGRYEYAVRVAVRKPQSVRVRQSVGLVN